MAHSWLYKLKGISRSSRKHLPSSPKHLSSSFSTDASSSRKLRDILRLSSSAHHPHGSSSPPKSSWNHLYKSSYANGISDSTAGSPTNPVSSSFSDQNYGFSCDPESHSVDIKDDHSVRNLGDVSEDSENSSPILVETVKQPPFDMRRTHQKLKKPKASSSGIRIRMNSPKITRKKTKGRTSPESKKGIVESFAIVLTSVDPERDFRESMVEMIVENKMKEQKDLEDLLACYLSLNSSEYHDIIIKAFKKTWFHLTHLT